MQPKSVLKSNTLDDSQRLSEIKSFMTTDLAGKTTVKSDLRHKLLSSSLNPGCFSSLGLFGKDSS